MLLLIQTETVKILLRSLCSSLYFELREIAFSKLVESYISVLYFLWFGLVFGPFLACTATNISDFSCSFPVCFNFIFPLNCKKLSYFKIWATLAHSVECKVFVRMSSTLSSYLCWYQLVCLMFKINCIWWCLLIVLCLIAHCSGLLSASITFFLLYTLCKFICRQWWTVME